jgi:hypothetical protein
MNEEPSVGFRNRINIFSQLFPNEDETFGETVRMKPHKFVN